MIDAIHREGGVLNKFIGDGLMALFGAPVPNEYHVFAAARAALRARDAVEELFVSRRNMGLEPLRIGIGINTGEVVAGTIGSPKRMDYTVIGDSVNLVGQTQTAENLQAAKAEIAGLRIDEDLAPLFDQQ